MANEAKDVRQILNDLRKSFLSKLPEKIGLLAGLVQKAGEQPASHEIIGELLNAVHKLHGSAGSYGLKDMSEIAGEWELLLQGYREHKLTLNNGGMEKTSAFLAELQEALKAVDSSDPVPDFHSAISAPEPVSDIQRPAGKKPRILLVEDDHDLMDLLYAALEVSGMEIMAAADVFTAFEMLRSKPFQPGDHGL